MTAYIVTVGDEILIGQITDTNSAWMAQQLNLQGIRIVGKTSVGDVHQEIIESIRYALTKADLVLMTGGLGATKDDITKKTIAEFFGVPMVWHQETYNRMDYFFKRINRTVTDINKNSCFMPENALVLKNDRGLAPAMWFEMDSEFPMSKVNFQAKNSEFQISDFKLQVGNTEGGTNVSKKQSSPKKILVSMPGVPYEMQHLMTDRVLPKLKDSFPMSPIVHRTILTAGEGETMLAEKLSDFEDRLPDHVKLAYLPSLGTVRLRLTARGTDENTLNQDLDTLKAELESVIQPAVAGYDDDTMPVVVGRMLKERGLRIASAESCTGGYLAHLLTSVAGSSAYFEGSVIAYSYDLKESLLDVSHETLMRVGAVSEECVREMVQGAVKRVGVDLAVAVSGIAGPGGETSDKPVGTIWLAVGNSEKITTTKLGIDRGRAKNIEYAANVGLNLIRKFLLS
ncbi:MAG: nicotinamide-nucleotide amidohydrolase family protein [Saprospiraceae bacterium]|nr:nicotinamide-nucleotide amidohydrolase family protein [Saprospiraceae bacterium]